VLIDKLLETRGPKARTQMERGFLADVEEADNVVRKVLDRKMATLGLASDQIW
jgi:hypothetical protein